LEHYDLAALALDEIVDRGLILELDSEEVAKRVAKVPTSILDLPLKEQSLSGAFSFAKDSLKSFLK